MENFNELKLSPSLSRAITELGYEKPTAIQAQALPVLLGGKTDFLGMAATGTGKTAAFGIPLLTRLDATSNETQAIVLCPTRELCVQVCEHLEKIGKYEGIRTLAIYGGAGYGDQIRGLRAGAQVVVATPGRLIDHIQRETISLANVKTMVLDEADKMISMGFKEDLETILNQTKTEDRSIWLFSATMSPGLRKVAQTYMRTPKTAEVNRTEMLSGTVKQIYYTVRDKNKSKVLCKLIDFADDFYGLIFCQTKSLVVDLTDFLRARGYRVDCLHGDKDQNSRDKTMNLFREKKTMVLVCTDLAARGLDVKELTHVINYSIPRELDSYVHRIGRTARSGKEGLAMSLVTPGDMYLVQKIEHITRSKMEAGMFPSNKQVSEKKLARFLPTYLSAVGNKRAEEVLALGDAWTAALEGMTKTEIAGRFLALQFPQLFDDRERAEELVVGAVGNRPAAHSRPERPQRDFRGPRREFGGPRREFGGPRREFSGPRREFGGPRREFDGPRREFDGPRREFDGPRRPFQRNDRPWTKRREDSGFSPPWKKREDSPAGAYAAKPNGKPKGKWAASSPVAAEQAESGPAQPFEPGRKRPRKPFSSKPFAKKPFAKRKPKQVSAAPAPQEA